MTTMLHSTGVSEAGEEPRWLVIGMIGVGMIFDETYRHFFERFADTPLLGVNHPAVRIRLGGIASRTGVRAETYRSLAPIAVQEFRSHVGPRASEALISESVDVVCVATPDDRHFAPARDALAAGKHVLIEKPSVLSLGELDELTAIAEANGVLCKVVYHKLLDPDHKKLRTHVVDGVLRHVNSGYCSLLEPKSIATGQFAEWVVGRNPASYVAVHYVKLIDFTFGPDWSLSRVTATGQRGLVRPVTDGEMPPSPPTWDSVLLRVVYTHSDRREAAFDIHTNWVNPDNFPGYVEQEVQFRFDNGVWLAHQRKRGVEMAVEDRSPHEIKNTPNHHYNAAVIEPWGERVNRGYGVEVIERFFREVAFVEHGRTGTRSERLQMVNQLSYNDIRADRNTVAVIQSLEAILAAQARGHPDAVVKVNAPSPGLHLFKPGFQIPDTLYSHRV
jgi:D-galacturonate reductase